MRARFVDADGHSFFRDIDYSLARRRVIVLLHADTSAFDFATPLPPESFRATRAAYRREEWHIPIGPLACPIPDPYTQPGGRGILDIVYRFQG